ncbi:MAG: tol-pal system protein YbgF [Nitrospirae bacterium]|nr:tol-pal system protein YbgF [Nitrospirota bacterium]
MKPLAAVFLILSVTACASSSDIDILRRDANDLKREHFEAKKEIDSLKEKTAGTVKEDSFSAVRENQAELNSRLSELSSGLRDMRGRFEEYKYFQEKTIKEAISERDILKSQIAGIEAQVRTLREKLTLLEEQGKAKEPAKETRPEMEKSSGNEKTEQAKPETSDQEQPAVKKDVPDDKAKSYESAYQSFRDKRYKESRERFEVFVKNFPNNDLTDNAQFWIAETYYAEKDFESAILAYETLLKKFTDSDKTASALLKQGLAFIEIGDNKTGKAILGKLLDRFPDSKDAQLAKKRLTEIEKKPGRKK